MRNAPVMTLLGRIVNPPEIRPDRRVISTKITFARCSSCSTPYSSERMQLGMNHKGCRVSPAGRFVKNS